MLNFFKSVIAGATIIFHSIGLMVGIKSEPQSYSYPSPSPIMQSFETPTPTPTKKPVVNNQQLDNSQQAVNNDQAITHNGSRTGPIVDYFELCTGKTIKVYENERIPYKRITGETVYSTKGDIKCYEDQIAQLRQQTSQNQNNNQYTFNQYAQDTANVLKENADYKTQFPPCYVNGQFYQYLTQQDCDNAKASKQQNQQQYQQDMQQSAQQQCDYLLQHLQSCKKDANAQYDVMVQQCNSPRSFVTGSSCIALAEQQKEISLYDCDRFYPYSRTCQ